MSDAERIAQLEAALKQLRRSHYSCEDGWYSCPLSNDGCLNDRTPKDECTCGADDNNALIDAALSSPLPAAELGDRRALGDIIKLRHALRELLMGCELVDGEQAILPRQMQEARATLDNAMSPLPHADGNITVSPLPAASVVVTEP